MEVSAEVCLPVEIHVEREEVGEVGFEVLGRKLA
jgi:hypothetical protein